MVQVIPHLYEVSALHKMLSKKLFLPRSCADFIVRGLKHLRNPAQSGERKSAAFSIEANRGNTAELISSGHAKFVPANTELLDLALADAQDIFECRRNAGELDALRDNANKGYLVPILRNTDFFEHQDIFRFITSRALIDVATAYFGCVPLLSQVSLNWSPVTEIVTGSQYFHLDEEDDRQLKLFINVMQCSETGGPLTFISAPESTRLRKLLRHRRGRLPDQAVMEAGLGEAPLVLTGPRGSGAWVDTSRCLHFGSRGNSTDRLMFFIQFTNHLAPKINVSHWHRGIDPWMENLDAIQKLALGVR